MEERELYPNAPVVFVALEIRHPNAGPLSPTQQRRIKQRLAPVLPIPRIGQVTKIEGMIGDTTSPIAHVEKFPKFFSRDSTVSAAFLNTRMVIETTKYQGWEKLRAVALLASQARREAGDIDGIERVGLRYINEIRTPGEVGTDWESWVDSSLMGAADIGGKLGLPAAKWQGVSVFGEAGSEYTIVLRYGPSDGYAVDPGGDLKRPTANPPGPYFLIDIDSAWVPRNGVPEFDVDFVNTTADEIHRPVDDLFEALITRRLREEVLRAA